MSELQHQVPAEVDVLLDAARVAILAHALEREKYVTGEQPDYNVPMQAFERLTRAVRAHHDQLLQLRTLIADLLKEMDWPHGGDVDGFTLQDLLEKHKVLLPQTATKPCGEGCNCVDYHGSAEAMKDGVTCFRKAAWLNKIQTK